MRMDYPTEKAKSTKRSETTTQKPMREKDVDTKIQLANTHQEPDGPKWPSETASSHQEPRASWTAKKGEPEA